MPNKNYLKGRRKEYSIMKELREQGCEIVLRSAGSHSAIDVIGINRATAEIICIQSKPDDYNKERIEKELKWINGLFKVKFMVR